MALSEMSASNTHSGMMLNRRSVLIWSLIVSPIYRLALVVWT